MDVSDLEPALGLPFAEDTSLDTVAVGILVTLASYATPLAGVVLVGYVARLVRVGGRHATGLPTFEDVLDVTVEGVRLSVVLVALQLPAVGVATAVLGSAATPFSVGAYAADPRMLQYVGLSTLDVVGLVVAGVAALAGAYLAAAATVALARTRSLVAAIPVTHTLARDSSFVPVVSASALVVFLGRSFGFLVGTVPFAGNALTAVTGFLTLAVAATLLGAGSNTVVVDGDRGEQHSSASTEKAGSSGRETVQ